MKDLYSYFTCIVLLSIPLNQRLSSARVIKTFGTHFNAEDLNSAVDTINAKSIEYENFLNQYVELPFVLRAKHFPTKSKNFLKDGQPVWSCVDCSDTNPRNMILHDKGDDDDDDANNFIEMKQPSPIALNEVGSLSQLSSNITVNSSSITVEQIADTLSKLKDVKIPEQPTIDFEVEMEVVDADYAVDRSTWYDNLKIQDSSDRYPVVEEVYEFPQNKTAIPEVEANVEVVPEHIGSVVLENNTSTLHENVLSSPATEEVVDDHAVTKLPDQNNVTDIPSNIPSSHDKTLPADLIESRTSTVIWYQHLLLSAENRLYVAFCLGCILTLLLVLSRDYLYNLYLQIPIQLIDILEQRILSLFKKKAFPEAIHVLEYYMPYFYLLRGEDDMDTNGFKHYLAKAYISIHESNKAITLLNEILLVYHTHGEDEYLARVYEDCGIAYRQVEEFPPSLHSLHQALRIFYEELYSASIQNPSAMVYTDINALLDSIQIDPSTIILHDQSYSFTESNVSSSASPTTRGGGDMSMSPETSSVLLELSGTESACSSPVSSRSVSPVQQQQQHQQHYLTPLKKQEEVIITSNGFRSPSRADSHVEYNDTVEHPTDEEEDDDDNDHPFEFFLSPLSDRFSREEDEEEDAQEDGGVRNSTTPTKSKTYIGSRVGDKKISSTEESSIITRKLEDDFHTFSTAIMTERTVITTTATQITTHLQSTTSHAHAHAHAHPVTLMENEYGMKLYQDLVQVSSMDIGRICYELGTIYELIDEYYYAILFYHHAHLIFQRLYEEQRLLPSEVLQYEKIVLTTTTYQEIQHNIEERVNALWNQIQTKERFKQAFEDNRKKQRIYSVMNYYTIFHIDQHPDAGTAFGMPTPSSTKI